MNEKMPWLNERDVVERLVDKIVWDCALKYDELRPLGHLWPMAVKAIWLRGYRAAQDATPPSPERPTALNPPPAGES